MAVTAAPVLAQDPTAVQESSFVLLRTTIQSVIMDIEQVVRTIPCQLSQLPVCDETRPPTKPFPLCTISANWVHIGNDASVSMNHKKCLPGQVLNSETRTFNMVIPSACPV